VTVQELLAALAADFSATPRAEGNWWTSLLEWLRELFADEGEAVPALGAARLAEIRRLIRSVPHYGAGVDRTPGSPCDNSLALHYTELLTRMIHDVFYRYRTHRGGRYLAGYWSMTNHAGFGMLTKATPNGRAGGKSFASGMTPCAGITRPDGQPTMILDQMLSVAAVDPKTVQNGYTYNLSLTTRGPGQRRADTELFARYMRSFAVSGGVLVQMCVSSLADLRAADAAATAASHAGAGPETREALARWKDLMIRVAGYSAYFVTLSPQMRREIIDRANFALADGVEQHPARNR
jgi:formate C-acetyltransferase